MEESGGAGKRAYAQHLVIFCLSHDQYGCIERALKKSKKGNLLEEYLKFVRQ